MNLPSLNHSEDFLVGIAEPSVELVVRVIGDGYLILLEKDGVIIDRKVLATEQHVAAWVQAIVSFVGQDLYVRLQSKGGRHLRGLLGLAMILSRQGVTVGLDKDSGVCRFPSGHLQ